MTWKVLVEGLAGIMGFGLMATGAFLIHPGAFLFFAGFTVIILSQGLAQIKTNKANQTPRKPCERTNP